MSLLIAMQPSFGPALVVGGGAVANRKVASLLQAGFAVVVVAPKVSAAIVATSATVHRREFTGTDLDGAAIVFACTNDRALNKAIGDRCRAAHVPVLVADAQSESTFFSPATTRRGSVQVGVTTGGAGPGLATSIRDSIDAILPQELAAEAEYLRRKRRTPNS